MNNMLGYMTICYKTNPSRARYIKEGGICTSRPSGWVGYLAELRSCDGCRTTLLFLFVLPELCVLRGLRLSLENS